PRPTPTPHTPTGSNQPHVPKPTPGLPPLTGPQKRLLNEIMTEATGEGLEFNESEIANWIRAGFTREEILDILRQRQRGKPTKKECIQAKKILKEIPRLANKYAKKIGRKRVA